MAFVTKRCWICATPRGAPPPIYALSGNPAPPRADFSCIEGGTTCASPPTPTGDDKAFVDGVSTILQETHVRASTVEAAVRNVGLLSSNESLFDRLGAVCRNIGRVLPPKDLRGCCEAVVNYSTLPYRPAAPLAGFLDDSSEHPQKWTKKNLRGKLAEDGKKSSCTESGERERLWLIARYLNADAPRVTNDESVHHTAWSTGKLVKEVRILGKKDNTPGAPKGEARRRALIAIFINSDAPRLVRRGGAGRGGGVAGGGRGRGARETGRGLRAHRRTGWGGVAHAFAGTLAVLVHGVYAVGPAGIR